jgi:glycosyltransferase involved in cell wall biosynthesis
MPKISIIVPSHTMANGAFFLARTLKSIGEQTFKDYEVIIKSNGRMAKNMNDGIRCAKGEIIKLLCMDDYLAHPDALQEIVDNWKGGWMATACAHLSVEDMVWAKGEDKGKPIPLGTVFDPHYAKYENRDKILLGGNTVGGLSVVAFKNEDPPLFDENLDWLVDVEFYTKLFDRWGTPTILNDINVIIGVGSHQTTQVLTDEYKANEGVYVQDRYFPTIDRLYERYCETKSDINEHLPTLMELTKECNHATELGVRYAVSTWAFLKGLKGRKGTKCVSVDIVKPEEFGVSTELLKKVASQEGTEWEFILGDSLEIEIEPTDLLFLDTIHTYKQVLAELKRHAPKTKKYIAIHDTETSKEELQPAINEFLGENPEWEMYKFHPKNNGLSVLRRK